MTHDDLHKPASSTVARDVRTLQSYQLYFTSGYYDARYPAPNQHTWRRILSQIGPDTRVLDFGCGTGRYLLGLQGRVAAAAGFDVSVAALSLLRARADAQNWAGLVLLGPDPQDLSDYVSRTGKFDLVLCLFGVLGHITDSPARRAALEQIRDSLTPKTGRFLVSVPNRARRFRAEQSESATAGLVQYARTTEGCEIVLNYQLFDPDTIRTELEEAGFTLHSIGSESVLPESWLLHNRMANWLDGWLAPLCPARFGYGIYAEASC